MTDHNNVRQRGLSIKSPSDVKKIARRVISDIFQENSQIENAAKVNQLLQTWLKAHEMEELSDLEKRLAELEKERRAI